MTTNDAPNDTAPATETETALPCVNCQALTSIGESLIPWCAVCCAIATALYEAKSDDAAGPATMLR